MSATQTSTSSDAAQAGYLSYVDALCQQAKGASRQAATLSSAQKNEALFAMADMIEASEGQIVEANAKDLANAKSNGLSDAMVDRLRLTPDRIKAMADGTRHIASLTDPVGQVIDGSVLANGLKMRKVRVPMGVIMMIYESRPNVTIDAGTLCFKSGNAAILRCGREALHSAHILGEIMQSALSQVGLDPSMIQVVDQTDREIVSLLLQRSESIDLVIPRGGHGLIEAVVKQSTIPVIKHYLGICHTYIHAQADADMAVAIAVNAKTQRPGVCNAMETLLVDQAIAADILPGLASAMADKGVALKGCVRARAVMNSMEAATDEDWATEYLDLILSIRVVDDLGAAIEHINTYGSGHSDAIVTESYRASQRFTLEVDSATVYVNASTRFTDGAEFGLGAEIGISTDKLHARGPMGLTELTTTKFIVEGNGQVKG